jgi:3,5-dihydroxyphenylacetyl-CoA synthase
VKAIAAELPGLAPRLTRARRLRESPSVDSTADALPQIGGLALAHPERSYTQEQVLERLGLAEDEFAQRIFGRCGVRTRRLALEDDAFFAGTVQGRTQEIERMLLSEATRAVDALGVRPEQIGVVVTSSLYTLAGPTLAHRLVEHYGMDPATDKYHVVGVGCASAVPLLRLAAQTLAGWAGGAGGTQTKALVVAAESMSGILSAAREGDERSKVVGASIFGDGCAAALVQAPPGPGAGVGADGSAIEAVEADGDGAGVGAPAILASRVHQVPGTLDAVRMQLSARDGYLHLIRELPDVAARGLGDLVDGFLNENGLERGQIDRWLLHPGGRRIIESLQDGLGLSREQAQSSFDVLAEHGNIGTPAIFYVLARSLRERAPAPGEHAMMVTVGPGVTVGLMLLRW